MNGVLSLDISRPFFGGFSFFFFLSRAALTMWLFSLELGGFLLALVRFWFCFFWGFGGAKQAEGAARKQANGNRKSLGHLKGAKTIAR